MTGTTLAKVTTVSLWNDSPCNGDWDNLSKCEPVWPIGKALGW